MQELTDTSGPAADGAAAPPGSSLLADTRRQLEAVCNNATVALFIMDERQQCVYLNPAAERLTGYTLAEVRGRALHDVIHHTRPDGSPYPLSECPIDQAFPQNNQEQGEETFVHKDGRFYPVAYTASPIREGGRPVGTIIEVRDITDRKRLDEERARLASLVEHSRDFVATADLQGRLTYLNAAGRRMIGLEDHQDFRALHFTDYVAPGFLEFFRDTVIPTVREHGLWEGEMQLRNLKSGALVDVFRSTFLVRDEHTGEPSYYGTVTRDITARKQALQRLRESEERLRATLENAAVGIARVALDGTWLDANDRLCQITGYSRDELLRGRFADITHPDDVEPDWALARRLLSGELSHYTLEKRYVRGDGSTVWVNLTASLVRDEGGAPRYFIAVVEDISARKEAEARQRESEATLRAYYESSPVCMGVVELAGDDILHVYDNPATCRFFGVRPGSTEGRWASELGSPPEVRAAWRAHYQESGRRRGPVHFELAHDFPGQSGRWLMVTVAPLPGGATGRPRYCYVGVDVTEQKEAEAGLRESEERFRTMADNISQLCWIAGPDGWITWYNRRWYDYTGATPEQMQGWGWQRVHDPEVLPAVMDRWRSCIATGEPLDMEFPLRGVDGTYRTFLTRARPVRDADGRVVRWFGTNTDVTEQRQALERLAAEDRRKTEFLAMLAHELRNPLAPIVNAVEVLRLRSGDDPLLHRQRAIIERQARHLARLVDDLLEISRINEGKIQLRPQRITVAAVVGAAVEAVRPRAEAKQQRLEVLLPPEPVWLSADPDRLAQVFSNLLDNATKYTGAGGSIRVTVEIAADSLQACVEDTGAGIRAEDLPHIFDLFAQADQGLARTQGGLGIGLTMVRQLVELHGGQVSASSDGEGCGSAFTVQLPRLNEEPGTAAAGGPVTAAVPDIPPGCRVLVVDDNVDSAETTAELLELWGYPVRVAADGAAALRAARDFRPRVVLLDIGLPGMNGYDVARRLRGEPQEGDLLLVAVTGYGQEEDRRRALEAGFDNHLAKPVDLELLRRMLESCR